MDSEEIPDDLLHEMASNMRRENVESIAGRCMKLRDATMDQLNNDYKKDVPFKYNVLMTWVQIKGAKMGDLKALIVEAIDKEIPIDKNIRERLNIKQNKPGNCAMQPVICKELINIFL